MLYIVYFVGVKKKKKKSLWLCFVKKVQQGEVQSPAPGDEQLWAPVPPGGHPAGKQLCKGPKNLGRHQVEQQCALASVKTNGILGCTRQSITSRSREILLLYSILVKLHLEYCVQFWVFPVQERHEHTEKSPIEGYKDDCWLDYLSLEERAGTVQPREGRLGGDLFTVH